MRKLYFLFGILLFVSCKKEQGLKEEIAYRKFDTVQYACGYLITFNAHYNGDQLVSLIGQVGAVRNYHFIYNSQGQLIQRDLETGSGRQKLTEYKYNSAGQLIEKKDLLPVCPSSTEYYKYTFKYDNGKMIESTAYVKDNTSPDYTFHLRRVYGWTGENITSVRAYDIYNVPYAETLNFTYDLTKANPVKIFKDFWMQDLYDSPGTIFFFLSKNLLTKWVFPTYDCPVNYDFSNSFGESRIRSMGPACLHALWTFTYTQ